MEENSANIDINARLVRPRVRKGGEGAFLRSRRARFSGVIKLVEAWEKQEERSDQEALGHFEKSAFAAPWDEKARRRLKTVTDALPVIDRPEVEEGTATVEQHD